jgi:protein-tyrosine-phosphatase
MISAGKTSILFVCSGNTCRSPMAKVILEQLLEQVGKANLYEVDSAALAGSSGLAANPYARKAIEGMFGEDLLAPHQAKALTQDLLSKADRILVMESWMKQGLPPKKTWTLKEYVGESGDIADPFGSSPRVYEGCAKELLSTLKVLASKLS